VIEAKSLSQKKRLDVQMKDYNKEAEKLLPKKIDWEFCDSPNFNQAIDDCKPIIIKLLKKIDELKKQIPEPIDQYQADPNIT
jgi:hypothetical protein